MYQYLIDHAVKNVWCNGEQDNQLIIAGQRITKVNGALNRFTSMNRVIDLPVQGKYFQVYQIGQVHPALLGLLNRNPGWVTENWIKFSDAINNLKLFVNIYNSSGIELPRYKSYYMFTNERNLIYAIEQDSRYPVNYKNDNVYLRLYTNAYFQSLRSDSLQDYLLCKGKEITDNQEILDLQNEVTDLKTKNGYVFCYKNGMLIDNIDMVTTAIGDSVEFVYDSSVKRVVTFTVSDLQTFNSILDSKYKYLLHYAGPDEGIIDYQDDIDIHIYNQLVNNRYKGIYYHRNSQDAVRMVTHRDYALPIDYYVYAAGNLETFISDVPLDQREFKIQLKIRKSGFHRPLIYDNNRIFELYKLADSDVIQAMTGVNANVGEWRSENLENSGYTELMRSNYSNINTNMLQRGYGYNSISKILGDTPVKTVLQSSRQVAAVPYGLYDNSTVYEYDQNGHLLGWHYHVSGTNYDAIDNNTRLVEIISGKGTDKPDVRFGTDNIALPTIDNYRVYMCYIVNDAPDNNWRDITDSEYYTVVDNVLVWNNLEIGQYLMVRTDNTFLAYDLDILPVAGTVYFTLSELETRFDLEQNHVLPVPLGELDIFLNGKSLIRDLDYRVEFPKIYIINKKHLLQPSGTTIQKLHVRFTGFANSDLTMDAIEDYGFIEHGFLSNNNRHDIRDDKVMRITVDGSVRHRGDIVVSEQHSGISVSNPINGLPYQIKDIVVPLKQLVDENTYSLRAKSQVIDQKISDYMTLKLPQPTRDAVSAIAERYPVVSPFLTHLINDLYTDQINDSQFYNNLSDNDIIEICRPYEFLLAFDPINPDNRLNDNFVIIHPHNLNSTIDLSIYKYRFLLRVVRLYANGLVDITPFVTITS